jgi:HSP20 family protein
MNAMMLDPHDRLLAPLATIPVCQRSRDGVDWFPAVDILEDADEYFFRIDLPELDPGAIQVTVEDGGLLVSGERPESAAGAKKCLRIERPRGHFERRFALPDDASQREISSTLDKGVLELHVHKINGSQRQLPKLAPPNTPPRLKLRPAS